MPPLNNPYIVTVLFPTGEVTSQRVSVDGIHSRALMKRTTPSARRPQHFTPDDNSPIEGTRVIVLRSDLCGPTEVLYDFTVQNKPTLIKTSEV